MDYNQRKFTQKKIVNFHNRVIIFEYDQDKPLYTKQSKFMLLLDKLKIKLRELLNLFF
jgi:hypothetical protein